MPPKDVLHICRCRRISNPSKPIAVCHFTPGGVRAFREIWIRGHPRLTTFGVGFVNWRNLHLFSDTDTKKIMTFQT